MKDVLDTLKKDVEIPDVVNKKAEKNNSACSGGSGALCGDGGGSGSKMEPQPFRRPAGIGGADETAGK